MVNVIYIALQIMGIKNKTLIDIIKLIPNKDVIKIFDRDIVEFQYKYNIDLTSYIEIFNNKKNVYDSIKRAEKVLEINKKLNIKTVIISNKLYPKNLKNIPNPPAILYIKGANITNLNEKAVACVGTRTPTIFGIRATQSIVTKLVIEDFTIVSGLALGIDAESHKACLQSNGKTIAVVANGLDMIYPKQNIDLAQAILKKDGTLVSEYPAGIKPEKFRFIDRNRIISGLAKGTIVFETKEKSGTMHTVNFTLKQSKKVFCPIPVKCNTESLGLIKLLREKKAIGIKTKDNYDLIIKELGYKIVNNKNKMHEIKSKSISSIMNVIYSNSNNLRDLNDLAKLKEIILDERVSFDVNKEIYYRFEKILDENKLSSQDFFNRIIFKVVKNYNKGE